MRIVGCLRLPAVPAQARVQGVDGIARLLNEADMKNVEFLRRDVLLKPLQFRGKAAFALRRADEDGPILFDMPADTTSGRALRNACALRVDRVDQRRENWASGWHPAGLAHGASGTRYGRFIASGTYLHGRQHVRGGQRG